MGNEEELQITLQLIFDGASRGRLAQSVERLAAEREVAGSIPGAGPILRVLK